MEASIRPWFTTGVALVGAGAMAIAPISPVAPAMPRIDVRAATTAALPQFELAALDLPYIITLPIVRQQIANWAENWVVYLGGFAKSGVGLAQSLLSIPGVTVEIVQQVLALDFVGAFDTFASAVRDSVIAVGQPLLDSLIWRNQKASVVQTALQAAVPQAFIDVINGFLTAGNGVTTALIQGTQDFVAALLTLDLGNIINAALDGTRTFVVSLAAGAGAIVDGIEAAQLGISTALATEPPPPAVADVSGLDTLAFSRMVSLADSPNDATLDPVADPDALLPIEDDAKLGVVVDEAAPAAEQEGIGSAPEPQVSPEVLGAEEVSPTIVSPEPTDPPKEPESPTVVKEEPKQVESTPGADDGSKQATAGAQKDAEAKDDAGANGAAASDPDDE
ncbi:MAG: hypothetical protein ABW137_18315 [Mycobacterium sp.]